MRRLLVVIAAFLSMACTDVRRGDGSVAAELTRPDLNPAERQVVEERFSSDFVEAARIGVSADALFGFARCELNAAPPAELVARGRSPAHCVGREPSGAPICGLWVLSATADGWVEVLETTGAPRLAGTTTNGWRDLVVERGGPPRAFKFDGAGYREDLGAVHPAAEALEPFGDYGDAASRVEWYAFDDPMPAAADAAFLWFYRTHVRGRRLGALPDAFMVGVADLDGALPAEVVVQGASPEFCAPEGCRHWLMTAPEDGRAPRLLGELVGFDLRVAATGGPGGRDLVLSEAEGLAVWRNEGDGWLRRAAPAE